MNTEHPNDDGQGRRVPRMDDLPKDSALDRVMALATKVSPDRAMIGAVLTELAQQCREIGKREASGEPAAVERIKDLLAAKEAIEKHAKQLERQDRMKLYVSAKLRREMREMANRAADELDFCQQRIASMEPQVEAYRALLTILRMGDRGGSGLAGQESIVWQLRQRVKELDAQAEAEKAEAQRQAPQSASPEQMAAANVAAAATREAAAERDGDKYDRPTDY